MELENNYFPGKVYGIWYLTDIDNTISFTKNKANKLKEPLNFYYKDNVPYSYVDSSVLHFIENMAKKFTVIPITARSFNSYKSTILYTLGYNLIPNYILNHGANIFLDHKEDQEWKAIIEEKYNKLVPKPEHLFLYLESLNSFRDKKIKLIDNLYIKIIFDDSINYRMLENVNLFEYDLIPDGRTLFIKPKFLNKKYALEYLKSKYNPSLTIGCGDSINDIDFLSLCDYQMIPKGSELVLSSKSSKK